MDVAYEQFRLAVFGWNRNLMRSFGHDIYDKNFKLHFGTYCIYIIFFVIEISLAYTFITHDGFTKFDCLYYCGLSMQVCLLFCSFPLMFNDCNYNDFQF